VTAYRQGERQEVPRQGGRLAFTGERRLLLLLRDDDAVRAISRDAGPLAWLAPARAYSEGGAAAHPLRAAHLRLRGGQAAQLARAARPVTRPRRQLDWKTPEVGVGRDVIFLQAALFHSG
jgi:hypothetical protein